MEFKLNKIDTDIRKRMQEEIKDNKVHSGKAITVKRDLKDEKKEKSKKDILEHEKVKKYMTIDVIKDGKEKVEVEVQKVENLDEINSKGRFLDAKK